MTEPSFHELFSVPNLSDAEWAARDAQVLAERAKEGADRDAADRVARVVALEDEGWPARALEEAQRATPRTAVAFLRTWDMRATNVVVLSGPAGTGKTVAAAVWAIERISSVPVFLRASAFANTSRFDESERRSWLRAGALVLDDLGAEYVDAKGNFLSSLDELIDTYYSSKRPLIITTNLLQPQFKERYGARIEDRIRECASWRNVVGESLRKRKS